MKKLLFSLLFSIPIFAQSTAYIIPAASVNAIDPSCGHPHVQIVAGVETIGCDSNYEVTNTTKQYKSDATTPLINAFVLTNNGSNVWTKTALYNSSYRASVGIPSDCSIGKPVPSTNGKWLFSVQFDINPSGGARGACISSTYKAYTPDLGVNYSLWEASGYPFTSSNSGPVMYGGVYGCDVLLLTCGTTVTTLNGTGNYAIGTTSITVTASGGIVGGQQLTITDATNGNETVTVLMSYPYGGSVTVPVTATTKLHPASGLNVTYNNNYVTNGGFLDGQWANGDYVYIGQLVHASLSSVATTWNITIFNTDASSIPQVVNQYRIPPPNWSADIRGPSQANCNSFMKPTSAILNGNDLEVFVNGDFVPGGNLTGTFSGTNSIIYTPSGGTAVANCTTALGITAASTGFFTFHFNLSTHVSTALTQFWPNSTSGLYDSATGIPYFYGEFPAQYNARYVFGFSPIFAAASYWSGSSATAMANPNTNSDIILIDTYNGAYYRLTNGTVAGSALAIKFGTATSSNFAIGGVCGNLSYNSSNGMLYCGLASGGNDTSPTQVTTTLQIATTGNLPPLGPVVSGNPSISGIKALGVKISYLVNPAYREQIAITNYGDSATGALLLAQNTWIGTHFNTIIGTSNNVSVYQSSLLPQLNYTDSAYQYIPQVYAFNQSVANTYSFSTPEDMFLHANQDYAATAWSQMDCFDIYEEPNYLVNGAGSCSQAINGAFTLNSSTYTDVTNSLYSTSTTLISDRLLVGYLNPFALMNITVSTARVGGSAIFRYWNGSGFANFTPTSDTTSGLTTSGLVSFTPPAAWVPSVQNGSKSKYWIEIAISGQTTSPVVQIKGDNWASSVSGMTNRGWNSTDSHIVGTGVLAYNPTPPATATANFRYQAESCCVAQYANSIMGNPTNTQSGKLTWAYSRLINWQANAAALGFSVNGSYLDDGGTLPTFTSPSISYESLVSPELGGSTYANADLSYITTLGALFKTTYGSSFKNCVNIVNTNLELALDCGEFENSGNPAPQRLGNTNMASHDLFLTGSSNPNNTKGIFAVWDNIGFFALAETENVMGTNYSATYQVDMANRNPIAILASELIAGNSNTLLKYNTCGYCYPYTDEYFWFGQTGPTLTSNLSVDLTNDEKDFTLANDSSVTIAGGLFTNTNTFTTAAQMMCTSNCGSGITSFSPNAGPGGGYYGYVVNINGNILNVSKTGTAHSWRTFDPIFNASTSGMASPFAIVGHQSTDVLPSLSSMWFWGNYFPAMSVNMGQPLTARNLTFIAASGLSPEFWTRSFTNAWVIFHAFHDGNDPNQLSIYGPATPISLGGTYYPLLANGHTGAGITTLQLRASEGAILMKSSF